MPFINLFKNFIATKTDIAIIKKLTILFINIPNLIPAGAQVEKSALFGGQLLKRHDPGRWGRVARQHHREHRM